MRMGRKPCFESCFRRKNYPIPFPASPLKGEELAASARRVRQRPLQCEQRQRGDDGACRDGDGVAEQSRYGVGHRQDEDAAVRNVQLRADAVVLDNIDAAQRLIRHLIEAGHRRIAFFYGAASATGRQRLQGYQEAMAAAGLAPVAQALKPTADEASAAMRRFLQESGSLPDAVVASSGLILLGLVQALREADLRFPDDVALAGFDDMPWTRVVTPAITVMAQPTYDIGRSAIERLLARIAQPEQAVHRIVLRGELLVRGSSAAR